MSPASKKKDIKHRTIPAKDPVKKNRQSEQDNRDLAEAMTAPPTLAEKNQIQATHQQAQLARMTVLYVEDDAAIRSQLQPFLKRRVGKLLVAENGQEGLEKFLAQSPDIVITDVRMPQMDGLTMSAAIKYHDGAVPIIVTTAFNDVDYLLQAIEAGIDRYVLKPVRTEALVKSLNDCAQSVHAEREAQLAASLIASVSEAVVVCDAKAHVVSVNPAYTRATGFSAVDILGKSVEQWLRPVAAQECPWLNEVSSAPWHGEALIETVRQEPFTAWTMYDPVRDRHGHVAYHVLMFYDITERKQAEDKMRLLAHFDALTGLPNRILFDDRLVQAVLSAQRHQENVGLLFVDLDKFKQVNDRHGHIVGDLLLQEVSKRMGECVRSCDTVSRRSGDEFVVLLPTIRDRQDAMIVSERIRTALELPFEIEGLTLQISASAGLALFPEDADDPRDLFHRADMAMYRAKKAGGNACKSVLVR